MRHLVGLGGIAALLASDGAKLPAADLTLDFAHLVSPPSARCEVHQISKFAKELEQCSAANLCRSVTNWATAAPSKEQVREMAAHLRQTLTSLNGLTNISTADRQDLRTMVAPELSRLLSEVAAGLLPTEVAMVVMGCRSGRDVNSAPVSVPGLQAKLVGFSTADKGAVVRIATSAQGTQRMRDAARKLIGQTFPADYSDSQTFHSLSQEALRYTADLIRLMALHQGDNQAAGMDLVYELDETAGIFAALGQDSGFAWYFSALRQSFEALQRQKYEGADKPLDLLTLGLMEGMHKLCAGMLSSPNDIDQALKELEDLRLRAPQHTLVEMSGLGVAHWAARQGHVAEGLAIAEDLAAEAVSSDVRAATAELAGTLGLIGKPFRISGKDLNGKEVDSRDWRNQMVIVDVWATWCGPCREDHRGLSGLEQAYPGRVKVVGLVQEDTAEKVRAYLKKHGFSWPQLMPGDFRVEVGDLSMNGFATKILPTYLVLDGKGRVIAMPDSGNIIQLVRSRLNGSSQGNSD